MATQMQPIVTVKDFNLRLGGKQIIKNLSFEIQPGEIFAFLGANGSGKTSTIRFLAFTSRLPANYSLAASFMSLIRPT